MSKLSKIEFLRFARLTLVFAAWLCSFAVMPARSWAQTANTGAVTGSVADATGAAVPSVQIEIASEATGERRTATSSTDGVYRVPLLPPGSYRIEASAKGFKLAVRPNVPVRVTETTSLDIKLEIGSISEVVTVQEEPQLTQTDSSALGRVTDEKSVKNLPLVSRNFTQIIGLSPGVSVGLTDAAQLGTGGGGVASFTNEDLSVNGARNYDNNFQMDGVTANDQASIEGAAAGIAIPNPDSIAEFKVQTGQYDASYGRNAGANVEVVTKGGSNQFHGNVFEFFRNEVLNANSYFFNADGVPRGLLRQNQFGGTFGGPIKKDKLLFFTSYQGTRQLNGVTAGCSSTFVGAPFTDDRSAPSLGAIYGGQSGALGGVAVAPDGSNINPVALTLLGLKLSDGTYAVPTPQKIANGQGQYAFSTPCTFSEDQFITNADFLQSARSKLSGKFFFADQNYAQDLISSNVPGSPQDTVSNWRNVSLTHSYIFSSNLLNQVEFGFHNIAFAQNTTQAVTFPGIGVAAVPQSSEVGQIYFGQEAIGDYASTNLPTTTYTLQDTLTYARGRHNMRFGGGLTRTSFFFQYHSGSDLTFLSVPDLLLGQSAAQNGSSFSNVYESDDGPGQTDRNYLIWNSWGYAQDDFKAFSRLTVNLGLRYERIGDFADTNGRNASFNVALANPNAPDSGSQAGYVLPSNFPGTIPMGSVRLNNKLAINGDGQNTWAPRAGFAWQVLPTSAVVVLRGGYGLYYSTLVGQQACQSAFVPPWALERFIGGINNAAATFAVPYGELYSASDFPMFPTYSPATRLNTRFPALSSRPAITQQYSLNLQTQVAKDYLLEVGYVGTRATHMLEMVSLNQAELATVSNPIRGETTNTLANIQSRVPFEGFIPTGLQSQQTTGTEWYNSLQVSLTKRFSYGLQFLASYTWAKLLDTEGGRTAVIASGNQLVPGDQNSVHARYGPSSTVRPQRVVVSFVEEFPPIVRQGLAGDFLNNWALSGVVTALSGHPLTILSQNPNNVFGISGYGVDHAEWAAGCSKSQLETRGSVKSKLGDYINQACIGAYPVIGDDGIGTGFGNMGTGLIDGPGEANLDLALIKHIPVRWFDRDSNWEFRSEFFNALNTPHFNDPDTTVTDGASFGVVSSTIANPRVIQFALKYNF
jgi:Carboxypeptidase regulatory-like domain